MCGQLCHSCQLCYHPDVLQLWMLQPRAPSPAWASHTPQLPAVLQPPRLCPGSSCAPAPAVPPPAVLAPLFCAIPPHTFARSRFCPSCAASPSCAPPASSCAQLCPAAAPRRPLAAAAPPAAARFSQLPPLTRPVPSYKPPVPPVSKGIVFPSSPHTAILPTGTSGFAGAFGYPLLSETLHFAESAKEKLLPWWCSHGKSSYPTLRGSRAFNRCERATPYFT